MTDHSTPDIIETLDGLGASAIVLAATASALGDERAGSPAQALMVDSARADVLNTLPEAESLLTAVWDSRRARSNHLISLLNQAAAAASGSTTTWSDLSDDVMIAQGQASALMARTLSSEIAPAYGFLAAEHSSRILDVGTGIGAIATALAAATPRGEVTGIDIAERPLEIARARLATAAGDVAERIRYRQQDVLELDEDAFYDVVWMPLPFLPDTIVDQALLRVTRALRPAGLIVLGVGAHTDDHRLAAANAWLASLSGGGSLTPGEVEERLVGRGYREIRHFPTVPGGPVLLAALAPERDGA